MSLRAFWHDIVDICCKNVAQASQWHQPVPSASAISQWHQPVPSASAISQWHRGDRKQGTESCNFLTDSRTFLMQEIMGVQNLNFAFKFPQNGRF